MPTVELKRVAVLPRERGQQNLQQVLGLVAMTRSPPPSVWWGRRTVTPKMLAKRQLIALPTGTGIRAQLELACAAAGVTPRVAFEASTPADLAGLAEGGLGLAILQESVSRTRQGLPALAIVPELRGRLVFAGRSSGPMSPARRVPVDMARRLLLLRVGR